MSRRSLQGLLLLLLYKIDDFANENKKYYNPFIKENLIIIIRYLDHFFESAIQTRDIYPELKKVYLLTALKCYVGRVLNDKI